MEPTGIISAATERLLQYGLLGILVLIFGVVIYVLWRESKTERLAYMAALERLQEARIKDANDSKAQLLDLVKQCTTALTAVTATLEQQENAMVEVRNGLKELSDLLRTLVENLRSRRS